MSDDPLDELDPLEIERRKDERLREIERLKERAANYQTRRRGFADRSPEQPEDDEPVSPERRLESFLTAAVAVHLEPSLDEEHAIREQLQWLREQYLELARDDEEELAAWGDVLTDTALDEAAAALSPAWPAWALDLGER